MNNVYDYDEIRNLTIGTVESVSPTEIKVLLEIDAPQSVAINTGVPTHFPTINGYVLIPNEQGAIVGVITWIGVEHSSYPKRNGLKDFDLIDLPFPLRKMSITLLGVLKKKYKDAFEIERGVYSFPSVGDNVILPTNKQLLSIVENSDGKIEIGKAPVAGNASIKVNPDKLFGRHLAVLGNTGSGKSCSVAGLIRWSLEEAEKHKKDEKKNLNSRFIILDPNGEYFDSFNDFGEGKIKKFRIKLDETETGFEQLKVPAWMWNSQEWISFSQAAPGSQRPILLQSLIDLKQGGNLQESMSIRIKTFLQTRKNLLLSYLSNLPNSEINYPRFMGFTDSLEKIILDLSFYSEQLDDGQLKSNIEELKLIVNDVLAKNKRTNRSGSPYYVAFSNEDVEILCNNVNSIIVSNFKDENVTSEINADTPIKINLEELIPYLGQLAENEGGAIIQFVQMLSLRMKFLLSDERLRSVVNPKNEITLIDWLNLYIGSDNAENGQISIIDLSLIPSDIIHIVVAVLSRLTFEAIQRYKRINKQELPTVLVLEEAHTFLRDFNNNNSNLCLETFERIAREGRKFGLSMVLSSQRPSELSQTVLSQCNTFLLHRIVNDRDQDLVRRLVPDSLSGLLKELPILPSRKAILVGWAFPIPVLVEMNFLEKEYRPRSNDPSFWDVWTGNSERKIDWDKIANDWQGTLTPHKCENLEKESIPIIPEDGDDLPF